MDTKLLQEILARRAEAHSRRGRDPFEALQAALDEMIAEAGKRFAGADLFCIKACLNGASKSLRVCDLPSSP